MSSLLLAFRADDLGGAEVAEPRGEPFIWSLGEIAPRFLAVAEGKIWFGFDVPGGEGAVGYGGIGFFDPSDSRVGLLRAPGLVGCSSDSLMISPEKIYVLTSGAGELSQFACNGLVAIDRVTGACRSWVPPGSGIIWNKDDEHDLLAAAMYAQPLSAIIEDRRWIPNPIPEFSTSDRQKIQDLGLEKWMKESAEAEEILAARAHASGEVLLDTEIVFSHNPRARPLFGSHGDPVDGIELNSPVADAYTPDRIELLVYADTRGIQRVQLAHPSRYVAGGIRNFFPGDTQVLHRLQGTGNRLWWVSIGEASPERFRIRIRQTQPSATTEETLR